MITVTHGLTQQAGMQSESALFYTVEVDGVHAEILQYLMSTYGGKSGDYLQSIVAFGFEDVLKDEAG